MNADIQAVLVAVLNFIRVELKTRIAEFLDFSLLHAFHNQPNSSFSASQQVRVAERWLVNNQSELETELHQRMANAFTHTPEKKEVPLEELELLDDESLRIVMLRAQVVSSLMEKARKPVVELEVRLDALKQAGAQINTKAFVPGKIADGLLEALSSLNMPTEVEIMLMEAYRDRGTVMLADFYTDLNALLIRHGILPDYQYKTSEPTVHRNKGSTHFGTHSQSGHAPAQSSAGEPVAGPSAESGVQPPVSRQDHQGNYTASAAANAPAHATPWPSVPSGTALPADFAQLLDAKLTAMQHALEHLTAETWQPGTLRDTFAIPPPISLSPEQEESIDHIEAVFLDLIRDTRISERFRTELNRLILPMMSLRLSDAQLFKDPENPVRRFLRQLALLGFRDKELPIREFEHISMIVGRIVAERAQEFESFKTGANALYTIAKNEVQYQLELRHKSRTPHAADKVSHVPEEIVIQSHHFTVDTLRKLSDGHFLPDIVQRFILELLAPWMMVKYQKHGQGSPEVKDCLVFAKVFFDMLEPAMNLNDLKSRMATRKKLLDKIAMEVFSFNKQGKKPAALLEELADYFDQLNALPKFRARHDKSGSHAKLISFLDSLPITHLSEWENA